MTAITIKHHLEFEVTRRGRLSAGRGADALESGHAEDAQPTRVTLVLGDVTIDVPEAVWGEQEATWPRR